MDTAGYPLKEDEQLVSYLNPQEGVDVHQAIARAWRPEWSGKVFVAVEDLADAHTQILKLCFDAETGGSDLQAALGRGFTADNTLTVRKAEPLDPDAPKDSGDGNGGMTDTQAVLNVVAEGDDDEDTA